MIGKKIKIICFLPIILLFAQCSLEKNEENLTAGIKKIDFKEVVNRTPKENEFQVDFEINAVVTDQTRQMIAQYQWVVEYLNLEEMIGANYFALNSSSSIMNAGRFKSGYYFLDVSTANPLNALLTTYKEGYYKVTFIVTTSKEIKEESIIIKVGNPDLPELYVKLNLPVLDKLGVNDFKGMLLLQIRNSVNTYKLQFSTYEIAKSWYKTGIKIDPFSLIEIKSATHKLADKEESFAFIKFDGSTDDYISALVSGKKLERVKAPLSFSSNDTVGSVLFKKEGELNWLDGKIFFALLEWGVDRNNSTFVYSEKVLNANNKTVNFEISTSKTSKLFFGSLGHKVIPSGYFVFFTPEGVVVDELDPKGIRDVSTLPYGYLIAKFDNSNSIFGIGSSFVYTFSSYARVYEKDKFGNYVISR